MKMRVAILGAGGFIGGHLVRGLAQLGWDIHAITSQPESITETPQVTIVECHWSKDGIEKAFTRVQTADLWVHAAANLDFSNRNLLGLYHNNAALTELVARSVAAFTPNAQLIYLSTISVYGKDQAIAIDCEPQPDTHYGLSKLLGERFCEAHLGKQCLVFRLAGVWGIEEFPKLFINQCLQQAKKGHPLTLKGSGEHKRNYLWVGDISAIVNEGFEKHWHGTHLAAGPKPISIRDMVIAIGTRFDVQVNFDKHLSSKDKPNVLVPVSPSIKTTPFIKSLQIETRIDH